MEQRWRIVMSPESGGDLEAIYQRIARDSALNAQQMCKRILEAIEGLAILPFRAVYQRTSKKLNMPVRALPVPPFVIYFRVVEAENIVNILTIRHGARRRKRF
jgi:plasmid stabilization system protein ParE